MARPEGKQNICHVQFIHIIHIQNTIFSSQEADDAGTRVMAYYMCSALFIIAPSCSQ